MVIELRKPGVPARAAFDENLTHYKQQIPALFWFNALLIASNGTDNRGETRSANARSAPVGMRKRSRDLVGFKAAMV